MRTQAYRPEVPGCLEGRSLLSGVAGPPADPVVFPHERLTRVAEHMENGFAEFVHGDGLTQIPNEINDVVVMIPFVRADGLELKLRGIVRAMRRAHAAHAPHVLRTGLHDVIAATRAELEARIRAGDVTVR